MSKSICSDEQKCPLQSFSLSSWNIQTFFQPFSGQHPGGDRFGLGYNTNEQLCFYIADATGHGEWAARFWEKHRKLFDHLWEEFLSSPGEVSDIYKFSSTLNASLIEDSSEQSQICLAIGSITNQGKLSFANFGYGVHLLIRVNGDPYKGEAKEMFGLKLGWASSGMWKTIPRAFVSHKMEKVDRLILMTDCFLGDDFRDPIKTLKQIEEMNSQCSQLEENQIIDYFRDNFPSEGDDASLLVINPTKNLTAD